MRPHADISSTNQGATVGIVLRRPPRATEIEPFYESLIAGLEDVVGRTTGSVLLQVVQTQSEELDAYRRWARTGQVSGVVLGNFVDGDGRAEFLRSLGLPAVVLGESVEMAGITSVVVDNYGAMMDAVTFLGDLGHRCIGRVSGPSEFIHTRSRGMAFAAAATKIGFTGHLVVGDYSRSSGERATATLLDLDRRPTAIVYDNDIMAVAGLRIALERGIDVPSELSLLAWDDSAMCRLSRPALSAVSRDVHALGEIAANALMHLITGDQPGGSELAPAAVVIARGTTGPPTGNH